MSTRIGLGLLRLVSIAALVLTGNAACAVTVDSSFGWSQAQYPVANTIDGVYGNSNMGWATETNSWVIYDFGVPTTVSKVRIAPPVYGGGSSQTFNPTSGTLEFSNDKTTWTAPIGWLSPALESVGRTDYSECALPQPMNYIYKMVSAQWRSGRKGGRDMVCGVPSDRCLGDEPGQYIHKSLSGMANGGP